MLRDKTEMFYLEILNIFFAFLLILFLGGVILKKVLDFIMMIIKKIVVVILIIFTIIIVMQVVARYVLHSPLTWSEQVARYLFIWMIMLGTPISFRMKAHIAFDLLVKKFPHSLQKIIGNINLVLITVFSAYYFVQSLNLCLRSGKTIAAGIEIPMNYIYSAQPVCAALLFIVCLEMLIDRITYFRTGKVVK